jgi:hypothetical protein
LFQDRFFLFLSVLQKIGQNLDCELRRYIIQLWLPRGWQDQRVSPRWPLLVTSRKRTSLVERHYAPSSLGSTSERLSDTAMARRCETLTSRLLIACWHAANACRSWWCFSVAARSTGSAFLSSSCHCLSVVGKK